MELPEGVNVETVTFVAFEDDSPTQVIFAGTEEDTVKMCTLNLYGSALLNAFIATLVPEGIASVETVVPDGVAG